MRGNPGSCSNNSYWNNYSRLVFDEEERGGSDQCKATHGYVGGQAKLNTSKW